MTFIETENYNLCVPSRHNLDIWTKWINSPLIRRTVLSTKIPKTVDMQWRWIENELSSKSRILLEICDKIDNAFLGVVSLSNINFENNSAQIGTISPMIKNKKNRFCVYEARVAISKYAFEELSINKVYSAMLYPQNKNFLVNNMCIGFEIEGINHDTSKSENIPLIFVNYFATKSIFEKKKIIFSNIEDLISRENRVLNEKKLSDLIHYLRVY